VTSTPSGVNAVRAYAARNDRGEWSGPFSVARQMIAARESARQRREAELELKENNGREHPLDEILEEAELEKKRSLHPSMRWKPMFINDQDGPQQPKVENTYVKRRRRAEIFNSESRQVPTLFQLCIGYLVQNFEFVESLGDRVDSSIRTKICESLVSAGKFNDAALEAIADTGLEVLELIDCANITQDQLVHVLHKLIPDGLEALILYHAGRCFGPKAVWAIVNSTSDTLPPIKTPTLSAIAISGAYLLSDEDARVLIEGTCQSLRSVEFRACPLLGQKFCGSLAHSYDTTTNPSSAPLLELVLEGLKLSHNDLTLLASTDALRNLRNIALLHIDQLDNGCVELILMAAGKSLEGINLSHNSLLTDDILPCVRRCNTLGNLRSLQLVGLKGLTSCGLEAFFTCDIEDLPQPPALRMLNLSQCAENSVTDQVIELALFTSSATLTSSGTISSECNYDECGHDCLPKRSGMGLAHLNISGAGKAVSDKSMENLVKYCPNSLRILDVSYCPNITNKGLGYLVTEVGDQLEKLSIWGMAQLSDEFHDGHRRTRDSRLEVIGSWMKKSTVLN